MGIGSQARLTGGAILNAGESVGKALKGLFTADGLRNTFNNMKGARAEAAAAASAPSGFLGKVGYVVSRPVAWSANAALWVVGKPVEAGLYGVRKTAEFVGRHPVGALAGAGVAAVAGVGLWARSRAERNTVESYQEAAMQMQAMRSPYMNSVTPEESALMQARMRQGGNGGSMAQMEQERRAAAQQAAAPATN